jgi:hypothetical protein
MVVVLNHIDTVPEDRRDAMVEDVRRLLAADGIPDVPVIPISARHGLGLDSLREEIGRRVADKRMTAGRIEADVRAAAAELRAAAGDAPTRALSTDRVAALDSALAEAAGVPAIVEAVERSARWRAGRATGWPLISWTSRLRPDPLKKLELDLGADARTLRGSGTALPQATAVQRARIDSEVRALADDVSQGLATPFAESVRAASTARLDEVGDRIDTAVRGVDLDATRLPVWAGAVRVLQWLLVLAALGGAAWSVAALASGGLSDLPRAGGVALPLLLLGGGVVLGVLLALLCRGLVSATARSRAAAADGRLRAAVSEVSAELVVAPVQAELTAYTAVRTGLDRALA